MIFPRPKIPETGIITEKVISVSELRLNCHMCGSVFYNVRANLEYPPLDVVVDEAGMRYRYVRILWINPDDLEDMCDCQKGFSKDPMFGFWLYEGITSNRN